MNRWVGIGAISGFMSVAIGAFGTHALRNRLSERMLAVFQTATHYQMFHALALIGLGLWAGQNPAARTDLTGWSFTTGSVLFCGSLYLLAVTDISWLGAITPFGGLAFLLGWASFAILAWKH